MQIDIITPEKTLYSTETAKSISCPGIDGSFQLLESHAPLVSALKAGVVVVEDSNSTHQFSIRTGLVECSNNKINVLVEE